MADQIVQITPGSGTNVDVSEVTVGTNTVERQRMNIADPTVANALATVSPQGGLSVTLVENLSETLSLMLDELTAIKLILAESFGQNVN